VATKIVNNAGHFDVMDYTVTKYYGKDIYKSYSEYGTKAYLEALKEATKDMTSPPSYLMVFDIAKQTGKLFINGNESHPRNPGEIQRKVDKYKRMKFKENTEKEDINEG
jgi:hypothetical protein